MSKETQVKSINMQEHLDNLPKVMRDALINASMAFIQAKLAMNARVGSQGQQPLGDKSYDELLKERRIALDAYFVAEKEASAYLIARGFV